VAYRSARFDAERCIVTSRKEETPWVSIRDAATRDALAIDADAPWFLGGPSGARFSPANWAKDVRSRTEADAGLNDLRTAFEALRRPVRQMGFGPLVQTVSLRGLLRAMMEDQELVRRERDLRVGLSFIVGEFDFIGAV
jgi:hypothetical protein